MIHSIVGGHRKLSFGELKPLVRYHNGGVRSLSLGYHNGGSKF